MPRQYEIGDTMPCIYEDIQVTEQHLVGFECDRCREKFSLDDFVNMQERFEWRNYAGYGSVWGDGNVVEVTLCQACAQDLLVEFATVKYYINE